jgi:hypothetical protein
METEIMHTTNQMFTRSFQPRLNWIAALAALTLCLGYSQLSVAQKSGPTTFESAGKAANALFQAVQNEDEEGVERILGAGKEVTSSNDESEDKLERERFSQKYQEMHRLVQEPDGTTVLYIGAENWPFPIPLVSKNGKWFFDSDAGMQEIFYRTVGENETTAIEVCREVAKAKEPSEADAAVDESIRKYAQSLASSETTDSNAQDTQKEPISFHGYYFRVVNSPSGGKKAGVAVVAYPAEYRSSGVMTFIVTKNGKVYEKDLGSKTTTLASKLERSPNSSWHAAE